MLIRDLPCTGSTCPNYRKRRIKEIQNAIKLQLTSVHRLYPAAAIFVVVMAVVAGSEECDVPRSILASAAVPVVLNHLLAHLSGTPRGIDVS